MNVENLLYSIVHLSTLTPASTHPWQTYRRQTTNHLATNNFLDLHAAIQDHTTYNHRSASYIDAFDYNLCSVLVGRMTCDCHSDKICGSTPAVRPTMLQAAKRGASSIPLLPFVVRN
jgi:hypothetical protein